MRNGAENVWRLSAIYYLSEKSSKFGRTNTRPQLARQARVGRVASVGPTWSGVISYL
jgi:hypothetical protein